MGFRRGSAYNLAVSPWVGHLTARASVSSTGKQRYQAKFSLRSLPIPKFHESMKFQSLLISKIDKH